MITAEYIAGVMDSDGSFSVSKRSGKTTSKGYMYRSVIQIGWKFSEEAKVVLEEIAQKYGGAVYTFIKKANSFGPQITCIKYMCEGDKAAAMSQDLLPFLRLKIKQAQLLIDIINVKKAWFNGKKSNRNKPESVWAAEEAIYQQFIAINTKNGGKGRSKREF